MTSKKEERFGFGNNWKHFLDTLNDERINEAKATLIDWIGMDDLTGKTFLDIGSGSGLFSLSARMLGAKVYSFDYDKDSVECARILKKRYFPNDDNWNIEQGDALSEKYLEKYGECDIVYSWGVLHHTGNMYKAIGNVLKNVKKGGTLFISIYNDQGLKSRIWTGIKRIYNKVARPFKMIMAVGYFIILWGIKYTIIDLIHLRPFETYRTYTKDRGMSPWHDVVDWVGGYPFEVAKPEEIFAFCHKRGFELEKMKTYGGGSACNQFLFRRVS